MTVETTVVGRQRRKGIEGENHERVKDQTGNAQAMSVNPVKRERRGHQNGGGNTRRPNNLE